MPWLPNNVLVYIYFYFFGEILKNTKYNNTYTYVFVPRN